MFRYWAMIEKIWEFPSLVNWPIKLIIVDILKGIKKWKRYHNYFNGIRNFRTIYKYWAMIEKIWEFP